MYHGWVGYINSRKNGSGLGRIYQFEEDMIRVGSDISSWGKMDQGWVGYIKLRKDESGLGQIYQVKEGLIRLKSDISS